MKHETFNPSSRDPSHPLVCIIRAIRYDSRKARKSTNKVHAPYVGKGKVIDINRHGIFT